MLRQQSGLLNGEKRKTLRSGQEPVKSEEAREERHPEQTFVFARGRIDDDLTPGGQGKPERMPGGFIGKDKGATHDKALTRR